MSQVFIQPLILQFDKLRFYRIKSWKSVHISSNVFAPFVSLCLTGSVRHNSVCGGIDWIQRPETLKLRESGKNENKVKFWPKYLLCVLIIFCHCTGHEKSPTHLLWISLLIKIFFIFLEIIQFDVLLRKFVGDENCPGQTWEEH